MDKIIEYIDQHNAMNFLKNMTTYLNHLEYEIYKRNDPTIYSISQKLK